MTIAELHGKLRPHESMEDLLTSDVFQAVKYCPLELTLQILSRGISFDKQTHFPSFSSNAKSINYYFWPRSSVGLEPDLIIIIDLESKESIVINIEAKYMSGKHNVELDSEKNGDAYGYSRLSGDQLLDQYHALKQSQYKGTLGEKIKGADRKYLFYLTAHYVPPEEDIKKTLNDFKDEKLHSEISCLFWLNWQTIWEEASQNKDKYNFPSNIILTDLMSLLERKRLRPLNLWKQRVGAIGRREGFWKRKFFNNSICKKQLSRPVFFKLI
jgi:hypothetical protein